MIGAICPHCKGNIKIIADETIYNLNRIGKSLYECDCCKKKLLIAYDGRNVKTMRVSK